MMFSSYFDDGFSRITFLLPSSKALFRSSKEMEFYGDLLHPRATMHDLDLQSAQVSVQLCIPVVQHKAVAEVSE